MSLNRQRFSHYVIAAVAFFSFAAGAMFSRATQARAAENRVFELRIYHAVPGKLPVMETRFREKTSSILARHHLNVLGYWTAEDDSQNSFIFLLAHETREEAAKNWNEMRADPEFQEIGKQEQVEKTLEKADIMFLRATDFSLLK